MNGAYLHLIVNHMPVIATPIFAVLVAAGLWRKSRDWTQAGLIGLVLVALVTLVVDQSGDRAEQVIRGLPGIEQVRIHDHQEAAEGAFVAIEVLGVFSLLGLWLQRRPNGIPKAFTALLLAGAIFSSCWMGWVAHLGGLIRHPEIEPVNGAMSTDAEAH